MKAVSEQFERICLEEYRVLRDEGLRSAQIISTTVWIGISGFVVTVGVGAAIYREKPIVLPVIILLLFVQALASSVMFLSETWKYARVGKYIRNKIEKLFFSTDSPNEMNSPLYWEHWIADKRINWFYYLSLFVLQLPVLVTSLALIGKLFQKDYPNLWLSEIGHCVGDKAYLMAFIIGIVVIDIITVLFIGCKLIQEKKIALEKKVESEPSTGTND